MKRNYYLLPLMAVTALSLSLAACDDKKEDAAAGTETTTTVVETPAAADVAAPAAVIHVEGATAYATAEGATTGAVFLTLHNPQSAPDKLVGASAPVSSGAELHETTTDANGVMQMNKVDAIEIQPGQQVSLKPDGYHIMLTGLSAPLVAGSSFDITLDFENAADVTLPVTVTAPTDTTTEAAPMDHSTMNHDGMGGDTNTMPMNGDTATTTTDESPAPAEAVAPTNEPMPEETTTTTPEGSATPDMAPTSSAPDASTTTPSAQ